MLSRVADNLYWMSRYLERAEHTARLLDVHLNLMLDDPREQSTTRRWSRLLSSLYQDIELDHPDDDYMLTYSLTCDMNNSASIVSCIAHARENARQVREQISSEMWEHLNKLFLSVRQADIKAVWDQQPHEFLRSVREGSHLFQGITDATIQHDEGWHFIQLGRSIERVMSINMLLDAHFSAFEFYPDYTVRQQEYFDWLGLLKFFTAFEAYCRAHNADLRADRIASFLLLDPSFPHSVRFSVEMIYNALNSIADATMTHRNSRPHRLVGRLRSGLSYDEVHDFIHSMHAYLQQINQQCNQIHEAVYDTYIYRPVESSLDQGV